MVYCQRVLNVKRCDKMLGSNVPTVGGLPNGFKYADEWGCDSIQIYVSPSRTWKVPELTDKEIQDFKSAWRNSRVKIVVGHIPYLVNLASSNDELRKKSIRRLKIEIKRAENFGVLYLVLHPGTNQNRKEGIRLIAEGLNEVLDQFNNLNTKILLETVAGEGNKIGSQFEELANILEKVNKVDYCGVCFDTCHVFAAGYDIRGYKGYHKVLEKFDRIIGISQIKVIHINDSKAGLGSHVDRHASIGEGLLGLQVFHAIVRDNRFDGIPKILEIPERDTKSKSNLELLRELKKRDTPIIEKLSKQLTLEGFKDVF